MSVAELDGRDSFQDAETSDKLRREGGTFHVPFVIR